VQAEAHTLRARYVPDQTVISGAAGLMADTPTSWRCDNDGPDQQGGCSGIHAAGALSR